jgi:osmotically-inducible protein OsmY
LHEGSQVKRRTSLVGLLGWSVGGAALGLAAGLIVSETLGEVGPARIRGMVRKRRRPAPARTGQLARLVRQALRLDPALSLLTLHALAVSAGTVELHGWVGTRALRARAARVARGVPGVDAIINCILVHGEDDFDSPEDSTASA